MEFIHLFFFTKFRIHKYDPCTIEYRKEIISDIFEQLHWSRLHYRHNFTQLITLFTIMICNVLFFLYIPACAQFGPSNPVAHTQVYALTPSVQVPPFSQRVDTHESERRKIITEHNLMNLMFFMPFKMPITFQNRS